MRTLEEILADYLTGESLSREEMAFLQKQLEENKANKEITCFWKLLEKRCLVDERLERSSAYNVLLRKIQRKSRIRKFIRFSPVAAGIVLFVGMFWMYYSSLQGVFVEQNVTQSNTGKVYVELKLANGEVILLTPGERDTIWIDQSKIINAGNVLAYANNEQDSVLKYNTLRVPVGAEYNLLLSDGTKVCLNSGSEIRYPIAFTGDQREVFLSGEAFFQVHRDVERRFIIHSGPMMAVVLGTSFNIRAYPQQDFIAATLQEGSLRVELPDSIYQMYPGTQVVFDKETKESVIREVNTELYISWKDGYYFFDRMPLGEILSTISLWYNITVVFEDPELENILFTGQLKRYADITYILQKFEETNSVKFIVEDNKIVVKKKTGW